MPDPASSAVLPSADVMMRWDVKIPLRDGVRLSATLYLPESLNEPAPALFTLTPYVAQRYHDYARYFASHGYPFLTVDVRGRGNSEGEFQPNFREGDDGYDVVEWLASQPYCNGRVAMWGGSYGGHAQWNTARKFPPHLVTIVPVASPYMGVDFPFRNNIFPTYVMRWLTLVAGRTSQETIFADHRFWSSQFQYWFERGVPFADLDRAIGNPSAIFREWISHPQPDAYWDRYNPTQEQYARLDLPILTITGIYDGDQPGALMHYRQHLRHAARAVHYLVIGPWDHSGTRAPQVEFAGLTVGPASVVDMRKLHREWYAWTMQGGPKPAFLQKPVAYYVMGAERWRYADSLEVVTARSACWHLHSHTDSSDVFHSGSLREEPAAESEPDGYLYDPCDFSLAALESTIDPEHRADQRLIYASTGRQLVYHSNPFGQDTEVSGFFKLTAWLAIDRPDTDFRAGVYEVGLDGQSILLSADWMRARYRESLREEKLIRTSRPLRYDFERFTFVSRLIRKGSRLRLVLGPINSIYSQKNYNNGGVVAEETVKDARPVAVRLFHDLAHPSALYVPIGAPESP